MSKVYKYNIVVWSASNQASNMLLDDLNKGDEYANEIYMDECDESELPPEVALLGYRIVSAEYAKKQKERAKKDELVRPNNNKPVCDGSCDLPNCYGGKLLNWRPNPDDKNSYLTEYNGTRFEVVYDKPGIEYKQMGGGGDWSCAYILPQYEPDAFFDHEFQYDTKEDAMKEAERVANNIKNGDE